MPGAEAVRRWVSKWTACSSSRMSSPPAPGGQPVGGWLTCWQAGVGGGMMWVFIKAVAFRLQRELLLQALSCRCTPATPRVKAQRTAPSLRHAAALQEPHAAALPGARDAAAAPRGRLPAGMPAQLQGGGQAGPGCPARRAGRPAHRAGPGGPWVKGCFLRGR